MCAAWKKKNGRNEIVCFIVISLAFLFFVALQGSVGEITNKEHFSLKNEKNLRAASRKLNLLVLIKRVDFEKHLWMSTSKLYLKRGYNPGVFLWTLLFKSTYFVLDLRMAGSGKPIRGSLFNKVASVTAWKHLTLSWRRPFSYRNQSNDLLSKSMDWFLYGIGPCHERVNSVALQISGLVSIWYQLPSWKS